MTLAAGTPLGPYVVVSPLGAGGMGEVYRARDARLERDADQQKELLDVELRNCKAPERFLQLKLLGRKLEAHFTALAGQQQAMRRGASKARGRRG